MDKLGQRGLFGFLTIILLGAGAILGNPGTFPISADGNIISPEFLLNGGIPLVMLFVMIRNLFTRITQKVNDPNDPFQAGKFLDLLKIKEFWIALATVIGAVFSIFGMQFMQSETSQGLFVMMAMGVANYLIYTWNQRPAGNVIIPTDTVAESVNNWNYNMKNLE